MLAKDAKTDYGRKSVTIRMHDSDTSPIPESDVLVESVPSAATSGISESDFIRLPGCEKEDS